MGAPRKPRKKYRPGKVFANPVAFVLTSMKGVAQYPDHLLTLKIRNSAALAAFAQGRATRDDMDLLVFVSNIVQALIAKGFGTQYKDMAAAAEAALMRIAKRAVAHKRLAVAGPDLKALQDLLDLQDAMMAVITIKDMDEAIEYVQRKQLHRQADLLPTLPAELT